MRITGRVKIDDELIFEIDEIIKDDDIYNKKYTPRYLSNLYARQIFDKYEKYLEEKIRNKIIWQK